MQKRRVVNLNVEENELLILIMLFNPRKNGIKF